MFPSFSFSSLTASGGTENLTKLGIESVLLGEMGTSQQLIECRLFDTIRLTFASVRQRNRFQSTALDPPSDSGIIYTQTTSNFTDSQQFFLYHSSFSYAIQSGTMTRHIFLLLT